MLPKTGATQIDRLLLGGIGGLLASLHMLWHAYHEIDNRESHQHDLKVLVAQEGYKKLEKALRLFQDTFRVSFNAVLDGDVDLIDGRSTHLPVIRRVSHLQALLSSDDATLPFLWRGISCHVIRLIYCRERGSSLLLLFFNRLRLGFINSIRLNRLELGRGALCSSCGNEVQVTHRGKHLLTRIILRCLLLLTLLILVFTIYVRSIFLDRLVLRPLYALLILQSLNILAETSGLIRNQIHIGRL